MAERPMKPDPADDADDVLPEDTEIVAYLDGEVDADEAKKLEARFALDPIARKRAEALRKTFDLLEYLPKPEPSPTFTTKTLTKLDAISGPLGNTTTQSTSKIVAPGPRPMARVYILAALFALVLGVGGQLVLGPYFTSTTDPDLADLPLIDRLPLYLGVDDFAFARELEKLRFYTDETETLTLAPNETISTTDTAAPVDTRQKRIDMFRSFPVQRRQQLRELHQQVTGLVNGERERLIRTLENYSLWLDRLPDDLRNKVLDAPNATARFVAIREVQNALWERQLPVGQREKLSLLSDPAEKLKLIQDWREKEQERLQEWNLATRQWNTLSAGGKPWPFSDETLSRSVEVFLKHHLKMDTPNVRASAGEINRLKVLSAATATNAAWVQYGAIILQLAERYPTLPEPREGKPCVDLEALPKKIRDELKLKNVQLNQRYRTKLGRWPDFALAVATDVKDPKLAALLGPCKPGEFSEDLEYFLKTDLFPKLTVEENRKLQRAEGLWPEYPRLLLELAKSKDMSVPGLTLPGKPSLWGKFYRYTATKDEVSE